MSNFSVNPPNTSLDRPPAPYGSDGKKYREDMAKEPPMTVNEIRAIYGQGPVFDGDRPSAFSQAWGRWAKREHERKQREERHRMLRRVIFWSRFWRRFGWFL